MYETMSLVYDRLFPMQPQTLSFLRHHLPSGPLLDVGCGTGSYAIALAAERDVTAIDADPSMIDVARTKFGADRVEFRIADMTTLTDRATYHGIYVIGNTLVHHDSIAGIQETLMRLHAALCSGGSLVIQIINYDRIRLHGIRTLATIDRGDLRMHRSYRVMGEKVRFTTVLEQKTHKMEGSVDLIGLGSKQLVEMLRACGFTDLETFGSFAGEPFQSASSYHLIAVATKQQKQ